MELRIGRIRREVATLEAASQAFQMHRDAEQAQGRGSMNDIPDGHVLDNGKRVASISYNGRVWNLDGSLLQEATSYAFKPADETRAIEERALCAELEAFCAQQDLKPESADEMLMRDDLSVLQRNWLANFCERWDAWHERWYPSDGSKPTGEDEPTAVASMGRPAVRALDALLRVVDQSPDTNNVSVFLRNADANLGLRVTICLDFDRDFCAMIGDNEETIRLHTLGIEASAWGKTIDEAMRALDALVARELDAIKMRQRAIRDMSAQRRAVQS